MSSTQALPGNWNADTDPAFSSRAVDLRPGRGRKKTETEHAAEYAIAPESREKPGGPAALGKTPGLEGTDLARLFETMDKLRECGVSEDISLPQLVVVGDQSSGKSSVLDALTGIPFPVASTLCTRFATQINFRRAAYPSVRVTITPAPSSEESRARGLRAFSRTASSLTAQSFCDLLSEASEAMGLPKPGETTSQSSGLRFADDTLKIELCGPDRLHFSVVDVPGLFQSATKLQTTEDIEVVESMVKRYLHDPRTIILAVASSVNETANQKIFGMAKQADPNGVRTVGLLTKPDIVQAGEELRVMDVALNRVTTLLHGWFVVRNRSTEEAKRGDVTAEQRRRIERNFFKTAPWDKLDKSRVGIESLEQYLRNMLYEHMRSEYPKLLCEIEEKIKSLRADIEKLGPERESVEQQRIFLIEIAMKFHSIARSTAMGDYRHILGLDDGDHDQNMRLRTTVRTLNDQFAKKVKADGHLHDLESTDTAHVFNWISEVHRKSRGTELDGLFPPYIISTLIRMQTKKWESISREHIQTVNRKVTNHITRLLQVLCPDSGVCSNLGVYLKRSLDQSFERACDELKSILESERSEDPMTFDDTFLEGVAKQRKKREMDRLGKALPIGSTAPPTTTAALVLANLEASIPLHDEQTVAEIFSNLKSYYRVARTRFIDCVCLHVIERHFLGAHGSAQAFSPALVGRMKEDELQMIAGQDASTVEKRRELVEKLRRLEKARDLLF